MQSFVSTMIISSLLLTKLSFYDTPSGGAWDDNITCELFAPNIRTLRTLTESPRRHLHHRPGLRRRQLRRPLHGPVEPDLAAFRQPRPHPPGHRRPGHQPRWRLEPPGQGLPGPGRRSRALERPARDARTELVYPVSMRGRHWAYLSTPESIVPVGPTPHTGDAAAACNERRNLRHVPERTSVTHLVGTRVIHLHGMRGAHLCGTRVAHVCGTRATHHYGPRVTQPMVRARLHARGVHTEWLSCQPDERLG
jgi:hypothetical protein